MVYKRNYGKMVRKSNPLRKRQRKKGYKGYTSGQMLRYAVSGVKLLKGIVNAELKRYDQGSNGSISTTMAINLASGTDQGDDVASRDGNSILAKYMTLRISCTINASATASNILVLVFADSQAVNGSTVTAAQLLTSATNTNSPINPDFTQRVIVLKRIQIDLDNSGVKTSSQEVYIPLNFHIRYTGTTGSSSYDKNNIFVALLSTEATNTPTFNMYTRLAFYDN